MALASTAKRGSKVAMLPSSPTRIPVPTRVSCEPHAIIKRSGKRRITLPIGIVNREPSGEIGKVGVRDALYPPCGVDAEVFGLTFYEGFPRPLSQHLTS